jgi:CTP:molybdopterin cytidylyltransferase MocA
MTARYGAVILAAGASTRLGRPKQLVEIEGEPALRRAARCALGTNPLDCVVVLGREHTQVEAALEGMPVRRLRIDDAGTGMAASLRAGVAALDIRCEGALIVLTDQPRLHVDHLLALCAAWRAAPGRAAASAYAGVLGVPALLPRAWFPAIASLRGDIGARALLRGRTDVVAVPEPDLARDIDVPADLDDTAAS